MGSGINVKNYIYGFKRQKLTVVIS